MENVVFTTSPFREVYLPQSLSGSCFFVSGLSKAVGSDDSRSPTDTGFIQMLFPLYIKSLSTTTDFAPDLSFFAPFFSYCLLVHSFWTITLSLMIKQVWLRLSGCVGLDLVFSEECSSRTELWRSPWGPLPEPAVWCDKLRGWQEQFFQERIPLKNLIFLGQVWKMTS